MYFADLANESMIGSGPDTRAVGWLDGKHRYPKGPVHADFCQKLMEHVRNPWRPFCFVGKHDCELCFSRRHSEYKNLWIPAEHVIYLAPAMILHYVKSHHYMPPEEFVEAVFRCPRQRSPEFMESMKPYMYHWQMFFSQPPSPTGGQA